jgi:Uma2 family endonuclease
MSYTSPKLLTFEAFIEQYGDNPRYELIDGELRDMEPTGPHEAIAGSLCSLIVVGWVDAGHTARVCTSFLKFGVVRNVSGDIS